MKMDGISAKEIAELCGVSLKTAQLYKTGRRKPGAAAQRLIDLHRAGRILPDNWESLYIKEGKLHCTNGDSFTAGQIEAYRMLVSISEIRARENQQLQQQIAEAESYIKYLDRHAPSAEVLNLPTDTIREIRHERQKHSRYFSG